MTFKNAVMGMVLVASAAVSAAEKERVFVWVDEAGKKHYSDTRPENVDAVQETIKKTNAGKIAGDSVPLSATVELAPGKTIPRHWLGKKRGEETPVELPHPR